MALNLSNVGEWIMKNPKFWRYYFSPSIKRHIVKFTSESCSDATKKCDARSELLFWFLNWLITAFVAIS